MKMKISKENYFLFFILIILALEAILFFIENKKLDNLFNNEETKIEKIQNILTNASIQARAISIYDQTQGVKIYAKNDDVSMPIASLTKIMTIILALSKHEESDVIFISQNALKQESDYGFFVNEKFKIEDLAKFTLIGSVNDGAYALAESVNNFLEQMNLKAKKIGMEKTLFLNPTGLDIDESHAGASATAEGMNILALYAFKGYPEIFSATILPEIKIKSLSGFEHNIKNTDVILDKIPNILFSKTGFTPLAGGNLTIIYKAKNGHIVAITVLGSTEEGRFIDMEKMVNILDN